MAAIFLQKRGFEIIGRNIKTSYKELDIVAFRDGLLLFVEVKTRTIFSFGLASDGIGSVKIDNLKKAVSIYLKEVNKIRYRNIRIDLIAIDISKKEKRAKIGWYQDII